MLIALAGHGAPANGALFQGDAATTLDAASCDLVLPPNSWHELDDHPVALREAARILRLDGRRAILDWRTTPSARPARRSITASPYATSSTFSSARLGHPPRQPRPLHRPRRRPVPAVLTAGKNAATANVARLVGDIRPA